MQGKHPEEAWAGGRLKKTPVPARESGIGSAACGAERGSGRPRNPPAAVEGYTPRAGGASMPQQNASQSAAATIRKDKCGRLVVRW